MCLAVSLGGQAGSDSRPGSAPLSYPFVGRGHETERIAHGLDDAISGRGRFFLLMGEPGIGKTRLCDEVTSVATVRGVPVLWGRAWEAGGAPAYWPWMDVLAGLARLLDGRDLIAALGDGAGLITDLVPEIRRSAHLAESPPSTSAPVTVSPPPDEARFRLWRTVVSLVRQAAEPAGLVIVFDDLHSADRSSLLMLYALARELRSLRVLVVATCRDVEARMDREAGELISKLGREAVILGITRLDRETVADLVRHRVGDLRPEIEARLFDSTQGNPLFVEEMLRLLVEEGEDSITAGVVPSGVKDVIGQRLDRVADDARALLDLAAVAGDEISPTLLAAASRREPPWIAGRIAEALRAGVFAERAGRPRFSHALVREVLYRALDDEKRRALHRDVGRAIEALAAGETALPLMELAHHAIEGPVDDLPRAVDFAVRAAGRAVELGGAEEAIAVLDRMAAAVERAGNPPALRARVLLALGETRIRRGDVVTGKSLCCQVATLAKALGDPALLASAALTYGRVFTFAVVDPVMVQLIEDALESQPPGDSATRARLLARLAGALQPSTTPEEPVRIAREAIATARRLGDPRGLLETMHDGLSALMDVVDPRERRALNLEVEALAIAQNDRERHLRTHARLAMDHLSLGEFPEADVRIDAFAQLARELRASWTLWRVPLLRAMRAVTGGRFDDAERLEEEARTLALSLQDPQAERAIILHHEGLLRTAARHDEMRAWEPRTRQARSTFHNGHAWQGLGSALLFTRLEDPDAVRFHLEALPDELRRPIDNLFGLFFMAEAVAYVGTPELARNLYDRLAPSGDQYVMLGMTQFQWEGPVARLLALLAARLERWDDAGLHFEDAILRLRRLQARPHLARAQYEFGRALQERGRAEDGERVHELFEDARAIAADLGMRDLVRLIEARLAQGPKTSSPSLSRSSPSRPEPAAQRLVASPPAPPSQPRQPTTMNATSPVPPPLTLLLEGEYWTVTASTGSTFRMKDSLGMQYLARLIADPGREFHVLDLVASGQGGADDVAIDTGDAGELLDDEARADYRRRLDDLRDALAEAESFGDAARATRAREEIDFLGAELGRAVGLGGRARRAGSAAERARSAVQRRIKNAIGRIAETDPGLGATLGRAIKTGNFCVYRPEATATDRFPTST